MDKFKIHKTGENYLFSDLKYAEGTKPEYDFTTNYEKFLRWDEDQNKWIDRREEYLILKNEGIEDKLQLATTVKEDRL